MLITPCEGVKSLFTSFLMLMDSFVASSTAVWRSVVPAFFCLHISIYARSQAPKPPQLCYDTISNNRCSSLFRLDVADDRHGHAKVGGRFPPYLVGDGGVLGQLVEGYGTSGHIRVSHRSAGSDDVLHKSRPLLLGPVDREDDSIDSYPANSTRVQQDLDQQWLRKLTEWHDEVTGTKQSAGGRKSRFKRPREAPPLPDFGETPVLQPTKRLHLEADEGVFFCPTPNDNLSQAVQSIPGEQQKWCKNVALSGGRAARGLRKRLREGELDSWSKAPTPIFPMQGDFRSQCVDKPVALLSASSRSVAATWNAVLAAAKAFEKNLATIKLDTMLDFFDHVRRLPPPNQVLDETTRIAQSVNECLNRLWKVCSEARTLRAKWMDLWHSDGVELEAARKALKAVTALQPDEYEDLQRQVSVVATWQTRLDEALAQSVLEDDSLKRNDLVPLEALALDAGLTHGFRCKGLQALQGRLEKAYDMRERLAALKSDQEPPKTVKTVANMVREIQRLKMRFPEANELLLFSREIDSWVERADIAIRSRMSLTEVEDLIRRGTDYRLDLSDYLDKLSSRVQQARTWLDSLEVVVDLDDNNLQWMSKIRAKLDQGLYNELHELACEGSRLPVEIDYVQMIHIELDARQWSTKAQSWIPNVGEALDTARRAKIDELREHVKKAVVLRDRLPRIDNGVWELLWESELSGLVSAADKWYEVYGQYFEGDSRKATSRRSLSINSLRTISEDGEKIPVNLGTAYSKVNRFLLQAETWYSSHHEMLVKAGLEDSTCPSSAPSETDGISLDVLKVAMDDANNAIAFDLEEVNKVSGLIGKLESWIEKAAFAAGSTKRRIRGKKVTFTMEDLQGLIEEASSLPIDTRDTVEALEARICSVQNWQKRITIDLGSVSKSFGGLREEIDKQFGNPGSFSRYSLLEDVEGPSVEVDQSVSRSVEDVEADNSVMDTSPTEGSSENQMQDRCPSQLSVNGIVDKLAKEVASSCVTTPEMDIVAMLEQLSRWTSRSIKYLEGNIEIFDKRFYGAFDRFLSEGKDLRSDIAVTEGNNTIISEVNLSCSGVLKDQLERLNVLLRDREEFSLWCDQAEKVLSKEDKRCSIDKLREMSRKAEKYPRDIEVVGQVKELTQWVDEWIEAASAFIKSEEKIKLLELKAMIDEGEKLGIQSNELRDLRNGFKAAKSWANRVKKSKPELGSTSMSDVQPLVDEYESLMAEMPEEIARLNKAMKHYCICRGHFDGQMIACHECYDFFHASCLGISKARAEKLDKLICVRCSTKKIHVLCSEAVASVVRKWTIETDLHKARQAEAQKHQRKMRKELKDIEKHRKIVDEAARRVAEIESLQGQAKNTPTPSLPTVPQSSTSADKTLGPHSAPGDSLEDAVTSEVNCTVQVAGLDTVSVIGPGSDTTLQGTTPETAIMQDPVSDTAVLQGTAPETTFLQAPLSDTTVLQDTAPETTVTQDAVPNTAVLPDTSPDATASQHSVHSTAVLADAAASHDVVPGTAASQDSVPDLAASQDTGPDDAALDSEKNDNLAKMRKATKSISLCNTRLTSLSSAATERRNQEELENAQSAQLRRWCLLVRDMIAPSTQNQVNDTRPGKSGDMSESMRAVMEEAEKLCVTIYKDVRAVENSFKCICWSIRTMEVLRRQPTAVAVEAVVAQGQLLKLPEDKTLRSLRTLLQKVDAWNLRFRRALAPVPGESKPFDMGELHELAKSADSIPLLLPYEHRLENVIEDEGCRYCLCGGPSDGRFMVGCDKCDKWFHGVCVGVAKADGDGLGEWFCPLCSGSPATPLSLVEKFHDTFDFESEEHEDEDVASKAPDPDTLWPPFGLNDSQEAVKALGPTDSVPVSVHHDDNGGATKLSLGLAATAAIDDSLISGGPVNNPSQYLVTSPEGSTESPSFVASLSREHTCQGDEATEMPGEQTRSENVLSTNSLEGVESSSPSLQGEATISFQASGSSQTNPCTSDENKINLLEGKDQKLQSLSSNEDSSFPLVPSTEPQIGVPNPEPEVYVAAS
jgi:hypothetical protein